MEKLDLPLHMNSSGEEKESLLVKCWSLQKSWLLILMTPKQSSSAVREVVKAMLSMRQKEDAVDALQNITNVAERERAIAEVSAWVCSYGGYGDGKEPCRSYCQSCR